MMQDILQFSVLEILDYYRKRTLSPVEVMRAVLAQIDIINPQFNAFVMLDDRASLLRLAISSERRWADGQTIGILDGIPTTIKDSYDIAGWPTRHGSILSSTDIVEKDSPPVALLRAAGALFIGKTTLPENGFRGVTESPLSGTTYNPWNKEKTSGGSSGGAAVAAATGMGFLHLGGDAGGSLRIPASFCGVYGIKPTPGQISRTTSGLLSSFSSAGPLTRHVCDAGLMLQVMSNTANKNSVSLPENLRIAFATTINDTLVDAAIEKHFLTTVKLLSSFGSVEEIILDIPKLVETFNAHWIAAAKLKLSQTEQAEHAKLDPYLLEWGQAELALTDYLEAEISRAVIADQMTKLLENYDVLVLPTMAIPAFDINCNAPVLSSGTTWEDWTPFTFPANLAGLPAASLPCGFTEKGLPVGVQIISASLRDDLVLSVSSELQKRLGFQGWLLQDTCEQVMVRS